ncbi:MAG: gas vesicle protein K [Eubacteriales bacterium]
MEYLDGDNNIELFGREMSDNKPEKCNNLGLDPENVEQGLAKLVLTVIELLRKLMENQAMRRIENGTVSDEETERMGETFIKLEEKMTELRAIFNLKESDLNIDLGPLGKLL